MSAARKSVFDGVEWTLAEKRAIVPISQVAKTEVSRLKRELSRIQEDYHECLWRLWKFPKSLWMLEGMPVGTMDAVQPLLGASNAGDTVCGGALAVILRYIEEMEADLGSGDCEGCMVMVIELSHLLPPIREEAREIRAIVQACAARLRGWKATTESLKK